MIRQWVILGILTIAFATAGNGFVQDALMYDPFDELVSTSKAPVATVKSPRGFKKAWSKSIVEKNIFSESRVPSDIAPVEISVQTENRIVAQSPPELVLNGIIKNPDESFVAYVQIGSNPTVGLMVGDRKDGVKVIGIEERKVVMGWKDNTIVLKLSSSPLLKK